MKLILDIPDNKVDFFMELIHNFKFIKAKTISSEKEQLFNDVNEAAINYNLIKKGKLKAKLAKDLLNEL